MVILLTLRYSAPAANYARPVLITSVASSLVIAFLIAHFFGFLTFTRQASPADSHMSGGSQHSGSAGKGILHGSTSSEQVCFVRLLSAVVTLVAVVQDTSKALLITLLAC